MATKNIVIFSMPVNRLIATKHDSKVSSCSINYLRLLVSMAINVLPWHPYIGEVYGQIVLIWHKRKCNLSRCTVYLLMQREVLTLQ